jgi:hypothetical protein
MKRLRHSLPFLAALTMATLACQAATGFLSRPQPEVESPIATAPVEAQDGPTEPAAADATPTPRRLELPPTPTPFTVSEDDPRSQLDLAHPSHIDYFDDPVTWFDWDTAGQAAYLLEDGRLVGKDYVPEETYTWWSYTDTASGNLYAEITAVNGDCIGRDSVGLAIRVDRSSAAGGYSLEISCDGAWRFRLHQVGGDQVELVDWTDADAITAGPGAANRLGIWAYQARFVLFANGTEVGRFWDTHYRHSYGTFAAYVRASQTYDLTATFDDFAYWNIDYLP